MLLPTVPLGHAGSHLSVAASLCLCYNENQLCHNLPMAVLRADSVSGTVGAPPEGVNVPRCHTL